MRQGCGLQLDAAQITHAAVVCRQLMLTIGRGLMLKERNTCAEAVPFLCLQWCFWICRHGQARTVFCMHRLALA